jgi:hypothetical protein
MRLDSYHFDDHRIPDRKFVNLTDLKLQNLGCTVMLTQNIEDVPQHYPKLIKI